MQTDNPIGNIEEFLDGVKEGLLKACKCRLEVEVVVWALLAMKQDPTLSTTEAMEVGLSEWVK